MVTVKIHGGLGNQMFQYAMGRALALRLGSDLRIDPSSLVDSTPRKNRTLRYYALSAAFAIDPPFNLAAKFEFAIRIPFFCTVFNKYYPPLLGALGYWRYVKEPHGARFNPAMLELNGDIYLDGYWRSEKYFAPYAEAIRKDFTFRHELSGAAGAIGALAEDIKKSKSVCVHIRRGDALGAWQTVHKPTLMPYYDRALPLMKQKIGGDIKIFVFSDDVPWCRENLKFDVPFVVVGDEYAGTNDRDHLQLMSLCKHFIIPESTFSWWAAWLATNPGKIVITPDDMFKDKTIDTSDMIPEGWLRL